MNVTYDLSISKICILFFGLAILFSTFLAIFLYLTEYKELIYLVLLGLLFTIHRFLRHLKRLKKPFIVCFTPTEIKNRYNEIYAWSDVTEVEIDENLLRLNVSNDNNFDIILILYSEISHIDFYRAKAYIIKYAKPNLIKIAES